MCVGACAGMSLSEGSEMAEVPVPGFWKYRAQKIASLKSEYHANIIKYPEVTSVIQQVCKLLGDTEYLAGWTPFEVGEISEWTSTINSTENRQTFANL
jgi:hypothetical protein